VKELGPKGRADVLQPAGVAVEQGREARSRPRRLSGPHDLGGHLEGGFGRLGLDGEGLLGPRPAVAIGAVAPSQGSDQELLNLKR